MFFDLLAQYGFGEWTLKLKGKLKTKLNYIYRNLKHTKVDGIEMKTMKRD